MGKVIDLCGGQTYDGPAIQASIVNALCPAPSQ
jgi:hypothetical protein